MQRLWGRIIAPEVLPGRDGLCASGSTCSKSLPPAGERQARCAAFERAAAGIAAHAADVLPHAFCAHTPSRNLLAYPGTLRIWALVTPCMLMEYNAAALFYTACESPCAPIPTGSTCRDTSALTSFKGVQQLWVDSGPYQPAQKYSTVYHFAVSRVTTFWRHPALLDSSMGDMTTSGN